MNNFFSPRRLLLAAAGLIAALPALAQNVYVLPNGTSSTGTVPVFSANPLAIAGNFTASPTTYTGLVGGPLNRTYLLARSGSDTLLVVDSANPANVISRLALGVTPNAFALSPDGQRLLIATTGGVRFFNTSTDTPSALTFTTDVGTNPIDVAVSRDSRRAYVLSADSSRLSAVDLATTGVVASVSIPGRPSSVSVSPAGVVYVTAQNILYEYDPVTLSSRGTFSLNAQPGRLQFTPDGRYAFSVNSTPQTGSLVLLLDLLQRTVTGITSTQISAGETLDQVVVVSNNRAFASSSRTGTLYDIGISPLSITSANGTLGASLQNVTAIATSGELPQARALYVGTTTNLYRIDLFNNIGVQGPVAIGNPAGALFYAATPSTSAPATILLYNGSQQIAPTGQFLPVVVRVVDAGGRPIIGAPVTFAVTNGTTTLGTPSTTTDRQGFAQTTVVTPVSGLVGAFPIVVTSGAASASTTLFAGSSNGGIGGAGGVFIVGGNGQIVAENLPSPSPLTVIVRDIAGTPIPNATVTFAVSSGSGALISATSVASCIFSPGFATCQTDATGQASVRFRADALFSSLAPVQSTVTASSGGASVSFIESTFSSQNGAASPLAQILKPAYDGTLQTLTVPAGGTVLGAIMLVVTDNRGAPLPGVGVRFRSTAPSADVPLPDAPVPPPPPVTCNGPGGTVLTDANGSVTCDLVGGSTVGTSTAFLEIGGGTQAFRYQIVVTPGGAARIAVISGSGQSVTIGQAAPQPLIVRLTDSANNPIANATVSFAAATPGALTLSATSAATDATGNASIRVTVANAAGSQLVTASANGQTANFTVNVSPASAAIAVVSGNSQTAQIGQAFGAPLTVVVRDVNLNPVANSVVTFTVASGTAVLSAPSALTNAQGQATVTVTAGLTAGPVTVNASAGGQIAVFSLTVTQLGPNVSVGSFVNGASFQQGVVPGGIVTINGTGLAPNIQGVVAANSVIGPLPLTLAGVQVLFNGVASPIFSVVNLNGQQSVTVQVPFEVNPGTASVTINVNGGTTTVQVPVQALQPGIFESVDVNNRRSAVLLKEDGSYVTQQNPARRGERIRLFATGLGQTAPATGTNRIGTGNQPVLTNVVVGVNNAGVQVLSAEYLPGTIGVYLVTFVVPTDAATGSNLPFALAAGQPLVFGGGSVISVQ